MNFFSTLLLHFQEFDKGYIHPASCNLSSPLQLVVISSPAPSLLLPSDDTLIASTSTKPCTSTKPSHISTGKICIIV